MSQHTTLGHVLVVDDEVQLMEVLVEALNAQGYEAVGFQTGEAAIQALQTKAFDVVLTDLMMPGMNGIALLNASLMIDHNLVGIIMTGQGTVPTAIDAMKSGAFDYVLKPFRLETILPMLARAMKVRQLRLENIQLHETVAMFQLSETIAHSLDSKVVLNTVMNAALQQTDGDEVSIMLLQPENQDLFIAAVRGRNRDHLLGQHISLQEGIAGWVARYLQPLILNGEVSDPRFTARWPRAEIRSAISIPMLTGGKLIGVLNINSLQPYRPFTPGKVKALSILTNTAAAALQNESLFNTLEAREKYFRSLTENAPDGITAVNKQGTAVYVSPSIERILGYSQEEALGQRVIKYVHPEDRSPLLRQLAKLPTEQSQALVQYRFRHKDGSWRWLESTISHLMSDPGVGTIVFNYRDITERKQAENALQEAKDFAENVIQTANVIFLQLDTAGNVLKLNAVAEEISGYSRSEIEGKNWFETLVPRDRYIYVWEEFIRIAKRGETPHIFENPILTKQGSERYIIWKNNVLREEDRIVGTISFGVDITERKQAEEALRVSEEQFRSLFEDSPISLWLEDFSGVKRQFDELKKNGIEDIPAYLSEHPDFVQECARQVRVLNMNNSAVKLYQARDKNELVGNLQDVLPNLPHEQLQYELAQLASGQLNFEREALDVTLTGEQIHISTRWSVAPGYEDSLAKVILSTIDITEKKRAERQIQRQLKHLNSLRKIDIAISSSFDMNVTLDIVLQEVQSQLGVDACAILLFHSEAQTTEYVASRGFRTHKLYRTQLKLGEGYAGQVVLEQRPIHIPDLQALKEKPDLSLHLKSESFVDYFGIPLIVKGEVKGLLEMYHRSPLDYAESQEFLEALARQAAIAIDNAQLVESLHRSNLTLEHRVVERTAELNQANLELGHANRAKDEFLATMSHELRTPLNSILGLSESLLEQVRGPLNDRQIRSVQHIEASGQHLLELINDILDLSKIDAGKFDIHPQPFEVDGLCRSSLAFVKEKATHKSISLNYEADPNASEIYADVRRLKQILVNLLTNAVKFTAEGGQVTLQVHAYPEQELIQFSVIDTGIGIAPDDLKRLFQPFVQVDSSLTREFEGTGLGLALIQKLADLHGGSVSVESEVGKGSRFTVNLPLQKEGGLPADAYPSDAQEQVAPTTTPPETTPERGVILLAEDNMANILTIGDYLESHGYKIVAIHDGVEAITKAEEVNPDIILMDIQMPLMDGIEATRRLRVDPRFASTPIIALTALAMPGDRERCLEAGATEYMSKPVGLKKLLRTINEMLEQKE